MTITARQNQLSHVLGLLGEVHAQTYSQSMTITTVYKEIHPGDNLARHGRGYASGTSSATEGLHPLAEFGAELVMSPQVRYLEAGTKVLNHQQTLQVLGAGASQAGSSSSAPSVIRGDSHYDVHVHMDELTSVRNVEDLIRVISLRQQMAGGVR